MIKNGFTLIEVLIALLAAAIITIMSFEFLSNTVFLKERVENSIKSDSAHANAINTMRLDFIQAIPFNFKDKNLSKLKSPLVASSDDRLLTFITISTSDRHTKISNLRRVIYAFENNQLIRKTTLSNNEAVIMSEEIILEGIDNVVLRFGDELSNFQENWPNSSTIEKIPFPLFVLFKYEFEGNEYQQIMSFFR